MLKKLPPSIFYSYAHADQLTFKFFVSAFRKFAAEKGYELDDWFDESIKTGRVWREEIATQIDNHRAMLVYITQNSIQREEVEKEVKTAIEKSKLIISLLADPNVSLPEYLEAYQAIKAYEYVTHLDDLYAKILETIVNPSSRKTREKRSKHNLYVAAIGKHAGRTSLITSLSNLIVDGYHAPGYFKPFQRRGEDLRDVEFLHDQFKLAELNFTPEKLAPFEFGANSPMCTEAQLSDYFERITNDRRPVMIEGILSSPRDMTLHQMIVGVFDARLMLIIDHGELERMTNETPVDLLYRLRDEMPDDPIGFVFNKVPSTGLSDIAREVRQVALELSFREVGLIPYDVRLSALSIGDIIQATGAEVLVPEDDDPEILNDLVWRTGHTNFTDQEACKFYKHQKDRGDDKGRIIFSGIERLGVILPLARLGYHLILTGTDSKPFLDHSVLNAAQENKKAILYFHGPTDEVMHRFSTTLSKGVPFCHPQKMEYLAEATAKLDKIMVDAVLKRT